MSFSAQEINKLIGEFPLLEQLQRTEPLLWLNPKLTDFSNASAQLPLSQSDVADASARLKRFAPYIAEAFPETAANKGIIESPLREVPLFKGQMELESAQRIPGRLMLKCDSHLPISGSIKARGGIYEVLKYAETVALEAELISTGACYTELNSDLCRNVFSQHQIVVGSTGNLGLSIGIMGAALGFLVTVHMSADARQWKKDLLRSKGVQVIEYEDDYSKAVEEGRKQALSQERCHFVDDENSSDLFLGYAVAAERLAKQLTEQNIQVDAVHPLFVYLPCGVGGGPGGVAFGLKLLFGDHVHCFFAEPTHSPCMLVGMYTGLHDQISVQELGIDNQTCADGLAVGRASGFVGKVMDPLLSGIYTVEDQKLYELLARIYETENIALEPSALAGAPGIVNLLSQGESYLNDHGLQDKMENATHIIWATGGSMVPEKEWQQYYQQGTKKF
ncbi:D-serine ammonia-lyase [Neptuniibacter caesariensis]|uniref:Probable D-serine dehydratase n=1 Tax=Neptuniibacter caesariensis TaxID=207954 RepID=A0A7U8C6R4_NEPCE|nr:D-serine ammonia-lyase [Neptuniibacter caesariensis]EAR62543.1 D-serine dehydratase [Oceanospirillum sp. MED92] [Neptuniibacter caesariensis]